MACLLPALMELIWNALLVGRIAGWLFPTDISHQKTEPFLINKKKKKDKY